MTRITKESLKARVQTLNMMLERPVTIFNADATASEQNIGHLLLDKNSDGYRLVEIINGSGSESNWSQRLTPKAMDLFIDGIVNGISLRNAHIGAMMIRNQLARHTDSTYTGMYDPANAEKLRKITNGKISQVITK